MRFMCESACWLYFYILYKYCIRSLFHTKKENYVFFVPTSLVLWFVLLFFLSSFGYSAFVDVSACFYYFSIYPCSRPLILFRRFRTFLLMLLQGVALPYIIYIFIMLFSIVHTYIFIQRKNCLAKDTLVLSLSLYNHFQFNSMASQHHDTEMNQC